MEGRERKGRGGVLLLRGGEVRRGRREEGMGGERRKKEGEREGRKGTEEGPTKNSCRGAQNVKLRHWLSLSMNNVFCPPAPRQTSIRYQRTS